MHPIIIFKQCHRDTKKQGKPFFPDHIPKETAIKSAAYIAQDDGKYASNMRAKPLGVI